MAVIGVLAGGGNLPFEVATAAQAKGGVFVIAFAGNADKKMKTFPYAEFSVLQVKDIIKRVKEEKCKKLVMIGSITRTAASISHMSHDFVADIPAKLMAYSQQETARQKHNSDDAMFTALVRYLEKDEGFEIVAADVVCPSLAARKGFVAEQKLSQTDKEDINLAARMARLFGKHSTGQSVVVCRGLVLAVEAAEGTDAMLRRIKDLPEGLRGTKTHKAGVLIKLPRPHQDRRIDLPTIGPDTIDHVAEVGLAGIVVEQNGALIYDRDQIIKKAEAAGIFVQVIGRR